MRQEYLSAHKFLDQINQLVPNDFKVKEKIDIILKGTYDKCHCGKLTKPNSKWCGISCMNKDPERNATISTKQKQNKDTRAKAMRQTLLQKYGVTSVQSIPAVKLKTKEKKQEYYAKVIRETFQSYNLDYDKYCDKGFLEQSCKHKSLNTLSVDFFNGMPLMTISRHFERIGFDPELIVSSSAGERDMASFIQSLGFEILTNDRNVIKPKELDIVIPERKIAIEFNGLYWHANDKFRHITKKTTAKEAGYKLIQFFEDEWYYKRNICESIIRSKLGVCDKVYARNTSIKKVPSKEAREFLEKTHIQGFVPGTHYGLYDNQGLVSIMSIGKNRFSSGVELLRFSNKINTTIVGGFSKLLSYVKQEINQEILSYADLRFSDGDIYEKFGTYIKTTDPGYFWIDRNSCKRIPRYKTMKHKLSSFLGNKFDPSKTEKENMINAGYLPIYDCGHNLYSL